MPSVPLLYHRSNANAVHLHILGKLLSMKGASSSNPTPNKGVCTTRLLGHVTSTCYKKMWHRFQHNTLSQPYVRYLKQVGTFDVDISKLDIPSHGTENDRLFLEKFFVTTKQSFQDRYPALSEQATRRRHENFQLYTKDTSAEFHRLFIFLLDGFGENLDQLVTLGAKEKVKVSSPCSKEFDDAVKLVVTYGYALHKLAHGPALRMHLQTISPLLESNFRSQVKMPVPGPGEEQEQEVDADLKAIQFVVGDEPVKNPLHQFYIDWLRLVVIQFDAVEVLVAFFANPKCPYGRISVQLLETPHGGQELLKWQELLEDDTLFPNTTKMDDSDVLDPSNKAIIEWLCSNIGAHELAKPLVGSWSSRKFGPVISSLKTLQSSKVPGWKESATRLLHQLKGLQDLPKIGDKSYPEIYAEVLSISQSYAFYVALASKTKDSKGDSKGDFNGTMHCEACLASLLFKDANVHNSLPEQMKVRYFSGSFFFHQSLISVQGLGISHWSIKTLLPNMSISAIPSREGERSAIHHKRLSQYLFSLHPAPVASGAYCGYDEPTFWGHFETGAYSTYVPRRIIASSYSVHWLT